MLRTAEVLPFFMWAAGHHPIPMAVGVVFTYFAFYRPTLGMLGKSFVIKMELVPETEEVLIQKVGAFGCVETRRAKVEDLEFCEKDEVEKEHMGFYRFTRSLVDGQMFFRIKSTRELLAFDNQGHWFEEGLHHPLML